MEKKLKISDCLLTNLYGGYGVFCCFGFFLINQTTEKNKPANFTGSNDLCATTYVSRVLS